jgi:hypothetical protein
MEYGCIYILGASKNPDKVDCCVPWKIDEENIFFGPCKIKLREMLKRNYPDMNIEGEDIYVIGLNGSNEKRKIIWAGKIKKLMTFGEAYKNPLLEGLKNSGYEYSPLHAKPISNGYQHLGKLHETNDDWICDLVEPRKKVNLIHKGETIICENEYEKTFKRDLCFLTSNIFFATGTGIEIDEDILGPFKKSQPGIEIDTYAIFGRQKNGFVEGKRGGWLKMQHNEINELIKIIERKARGIKKKVTKPSKDKGSC